MSKPDWEAIETAYRAGVMSLREIASQHGISEGAIRNTEVTFNTPLVRTVTDQDVTRVRLNIGVTGLVEQDTKGNQKETSVTMVIETRVAGGAFIQQKVVTITGKISGEYLEAHLIDAPITTINLLLSAPGRASSPGLRLSSVPFASICRITGN